VFSDHFDDYMSNPRYRKHDKIDIILNIKTYFSRG